jgi:hypothetical protein
MMMMMMMMFDYKEMTLRLGAHLSIRGSPTTFIGGVSPLLSLSTCRARSQISWTSLPVPSSIHQFPFFNGMTPFRRISSATRKSDMNIDNGDDWKLEQGQPFSVGKTLKVPYLHFARPLIICASF